MQLFLYYLIGVSIIGVSVFPNGGSSRIQHYEKDASAALHNTTAFPAGAVTITLKTLLGSRSVFDKEWKESVITVGTIAPQGGYSFTLPANTYVKEIGITIRDKTIAFAPNLLGDRLTDRGYEFFITGPPDGSDIKIIDIVQ